MHYLHMVNVGLSKKVKVHEKGTIRAKILPEFRGYIGPYRNGGRPKRETRPATNRSGCNLRHINPLEGPTMNKFITNFLNEEDGAVTVDWVVLTAAVVGLGVAGVAAVQGGVDSLAGKIETEVGGAGVVTLSDTTLGQSPEEGG